MVNPMAKAVTSTGEMTRRAKPYRWRRYLGALFCIGVSGVFLYLAVRKTDFLEVRKALGAVHLPWLLPLIAVALVDFWLRAVRWSWLFPSKQRPTLRQTFSVLMIGTMTNNVVPGRLGDIARAGMIGRIVPVLGTSGALATVVLEKVVDGLTLLALLGVALLVAPLPSLLAKSGALGSLVMLGSLLFLLVIKAHSEENRTRSDITSDRSTLRKLFRRIQRLLQGFVLGLNALNSKKQTLVVFILTLAIWLLEFSIMFVVFRMFSLDLPFVAAVVTAVIVSVGIMLPAAPGAIGTYQFFTITGLHLYDVPESQALAMGVFLNLFILTNSTVLGLLALSVEGVNWVSPLKNYQL